MPSYNEQEALELESRPEMSPRSLSSSELSSSSSSSLSSSIQGESSLGIPFSDLADLPQDLYELTNRLKTGESAERLFLREQLSAAGATKIAEMRLTWHERILAIQLLDYFRDGIYSFNNRRGVPGDLFPDPSKKAQFLIDYTNARNNARSLSEMNQGFIDALKTYFNIADEQVILEALDGYAVSRHSLSELTLIISFLEKVMAVHHLNWESSCIENDVFFLLISTVISFKEKLDILSKIYAPFIDSGLAPINGAVQKLVAFASNHIFTLIPKMQQLPAEKQLEVINHLLTMGYAYDESTLISAAFILLLHLRTLPRQAAEPSSAMSSSSSLPLPNRECLNEKLPEPICELIKKCYERKITDNLFIHLEKLIALAFRKIDGCFFAYDPNDSLDLYLKTRICSLIEEKIKINKSEFFEKNRDETTILIYKEYLTKLTTTLDSRNMSLISEIIVRDVQVLMAAINVSPSTYDNTTFFMRALSNEDIMDMTNPDLTYTKLIAEYNVYVKSAGISLSQIVLMLIKIFLLSKGSHAKLQELNSNLSKMIDDEVKKDMEEGLASFLLGLADFISSVVSLPPNNVMKIKNLITFLIENNMHLNGGYTLGDFAILMFLAVSTKLPDSSKLTQIIYGYIAETDTQSKHLFMQEAYLLTALMIGLKKEDTITVLHKDLLNMRKMITSCLGDSTASKAVATKDATTVCLLADITPDTDVSTSVATDSLSDIIEPAVASILLSIIDTLAKAGAAPKIESLPTTRSVPNLSRVSSSSLYSSSSSSSSSSSASRTGLRPRRIYSTADLSTFHSGTRGSSRPDSKDGGLRRGPT